MTMKQRHKANLIPVSIFLVLLILTILFVAPLVIVLMNSFKGQFFISSTPFSLPASDTFVKLANYFNGVAKIKFFDAFGYSLFITVFSVALIVLFTSMAAWYLIRVKNKLTSVLYYMFVFSMIVPFQMVMYSLVKVANVFSLDNPVGILFVYMGFGSGLSVFLYSGFVKGIPLEIEEAAMIDGCTPIQNFFGVVFPMLQPTAITVAILNTMWIWNDFLLPYLLIGTKYRTIPIAIQYLQGGYGSRDMGALMAMLVLAIIPIIAFYFFAQKYIIKGVTAGAVKG